MTLPSSGELSMGLIRSELGIPNQSNFSLDSAENGSYVPINQNSPFKPSASNPAAISEWYSYNHNAGGTVFQFLESGVYTWNAPTTGTITIQLWAGGGAGGSVLYESFGNRDRNGVGGGGGGGKYGKFTLSVTAGTNYTVVVGNGGSPRTFLMSNPPLADGSYRSWYGGRSEFNVGVGVTSGGAVPPGMPTGWRIYVEGGQGGGSDVDILDAPYGGKGATGYAYASGVTLVSHYNGGNGGSGYPSVDPLYYSAGGYNYDGGQGGGGGAGSTQNGFQADFTGPSYAAGPGGVDYGGSGGDPKLIHGSGINAPASGFGGGGGGAKYTSIQTFETYWGRPGGYGRSGAVIINY